MNKERLQELYTRYHRDKGKYGRKTGGSERVLLIKGIIGTGRRVLDLGCRDGSFTRFLVDGNEVVGADIDEVALALCRENLGIETRHTDLNDELPFDDASFDAVFAGEVIEHIALPEFFIEESRRVLRPGGIFCGTTPNAYRLKTRMRFLFGKPLCGDPTHLRFFSYHSLKILLIQHFASVEIIPFHGHIIGSNRCGIPVTRTTPLFLGRLFSRHFLWKAVKA